MPKEDSPVFSDEGEANIDYDRKSSREKKKKKHKSSIAYKRLRTPSNSDGEPCFEVSFSESPVKEEPRPKKRRGRPPKNSKQPSSLTPLGKFKTVQQSKIEAEDQKCTQCNKYFPVKHDLLEHHLKSHFRRRFLNDFYGAFKANNGHCPKCAQELTDFKAVLHHVCDAHEDVIYNYLEEAEGNVPSDNKEESQRATSISSAVELQPDHESAQASLWICPVCRTARPSKFRLYQHLALTHHKNQLRSRYMKGFLANGCHCQFCGKPFDKDKIFVHIGAKHHKVENFLSIPIKPSPMNAELLQEDGVPMHPIETQKPKKKTRKNSFKELCYNGVRITKTCPFCNKQKNAISSMLQHVSLTHCKNKLIQKYKAQYLENGKRCPLCNVQADTLLIFLGHVGAVHKEVVPFVADEIKKTQAQAVSLVEDKMDVVGEKDFDNNGEDVIDENSFSCPICDRPFLSHDEMLNHLAMDHFFKEIFEKYAGNWDSSVGTCPLCSSILKSPDELVCHLASAHDAYKEFILSGFTIPEHGDLNNTTFGENGTKSCPVCFKCFYKKGALQSHLTGVHHGKELEINFGHYFVNGACQLCGKSAANKQAFLRHVGIIHQKVLDFVPESKRGAYDAVLSRRKYNAGTEPEPEPAADVRLDEPTDFHEESDDSGEVPDPDASYGAINFLEEEEDQEPAD